MNSGRPLSPELQSAVERAREKKQAEIARGVADAALQNEKDKPAQKEVELKQAINTVRHHAQETVDLLKSLGIPPHHEYTRIMGLTGGGRFLPARQIKQEHKIWLLSHSAGDYSYTISDRQGLGYFSAESFIGLDEEAQIHIGYVADGQCHIVLKDESLLFGPVAPIKNPPGWVQDPRIIHREEASQLAPDSVVTAWQDCFAEGILRLTEAQ